MKTRVSLKYPVNDCSPVQQFSLAIQVVTQPKPPRIQKIAPRAQRILTRICPEKIENLSVKSFRKH